MASILRFETVEEMAEAYAMVYNDKYSDPIKHLSTANVLQICVTILNPIAARVKYGLLISKQTKQIENFGYVAN